MKGGYRWNAGRPRTRSAGLTSDCRWLDVRQLAREGTLERDGRHVVTWQSGATIELAVSGERLKLRYSFRQNGGEWQRIEQAISLASTPCHFGGARAWFCCPRCSQRAAILYLNGWPACRTCCRLAYPCQSADWIGRGWINQWKIERRLASGAERWNFRRPKGMHGPTFESLRKKVWEIELAREEALADYARRLGMVI
jgi:hypothetical protein